MRKVLYFFIFLMCLLVQTTYFALAQENPEWKNCTQVSDCIVVVDGCCITAVNKAFSKDGQDYCAQKNSVVECGTLLDHKKSTAKCQKKPVPCLDGAPEGCFSKRAKCQIVDDLPPE